MGNRDDVSLDERRWLCEQKVTLDGAPARITGYTLPFAHIRRSDGSGGVVEWAWATAAAIVAAGGAFRTS